MGTPALRHYMDNVAVASPVHQGNVTDWDGMEALWTHAMKNTLSVDLQEHPVLLVLSSFASDDTQAKYVQMMFETFNPPALFVCKEAVMVAFELRIAALHDELRAQVSLSRHPCSHPEMPGRLNILRTWRA